MPEIGEIKKGKEIGKDKDHKYIWQACSDCGKERWVHLRQGIPISRLCKRCAVKGRILSEEVKKKMKLSREGRKQYLWKGGRVKRSGYIGVSLSKSSPYFPMTMKESLNSYVLEHRLVMAQSLGRCLAKSEHVHHINGIKDDNRIENLELLSPSNHSLKSQLCSGCELRKEIRLQRWQIKELTEQVRNLTSKLMGVV